MGFYHAAIDRHIRRALDEAITNKRSREQSILAGVPFVYRKDKDLFDYTERSIRQLGEIMRIRNVLVNEYKADTLEVSVKDQFWDLDALLNGSQILSAITGSHFVPKGPNKIQSAVGGAFGGAAIGAELGPTGAGIGAIGGGILGLLSAG